LITNYYNTEYFESQIKKYEYFMKKTSNSNAFSLQTDLSIDIMLDKIKYENILIKNSFIKTK
jgi:hypothetical protein